MILAALTTETKTERREVVTGPEREAVERGGVGHVTGIAGVGVGNAAGEVVLESGGVVPEIKIAHMREAGEENVPMTTPRMLWRTGRQRDREPRPDTRAREGQSQDGGTLPRGDLSIYRRCSTRPCKLPDKYPLWEHLLQHWVRPQRLSLFPLPLSQLPVR